jgi:hypothetical protein
MGTGGGFLLRGGVTKCFSTINYCLPTISYYLSGLAIGGDNVRTNTNIYGSDEEE